MEAERAKEKASGKRSELIDQWATDYDAYIGVLRIQDKDGHIVPLKPNTIQSEFERRRSFRDIVLKPRQVGLTTWELARDIWFFLTRAAVNVVIVVQSDSLRRPLRSVAKAVNLMFGAIREAGVELEFKTESVGEWVLGDSTLKIIQAGGSEKAASKSGRGGTIHRLHITELAFFEHAEATLTAILECVPTADRGSEITIESTPNGASGKFYEKYSEAKAGNDYRPHFFRWLDHAEYALTLAPGETVVAETSREKRLAEVGATPEQIKWYRAKVKDRGQDKVDQEYPVDEETCWLSEGRLFFDRERTVELRGQCRAPLATELHGFLRVWKRPEPRVQYVIGADPSEGMGGDPGAAIVTDRLTGEHVATLHGQMQTHRFAELLDIVGRTYNLALIAVERNNHGVAVLNALSDPPRSSERERYPNIYAGTDGKLGWNSTETSRAVALDALEEDHRKGNWSSPDVALIGEMIVFAVIKDKPQAPTGAHDDLVLAAGIAQFVSRVPVRAMGGAMTVSNFEDQPIGD